MTEIDPEVLDLAQLRQFTAGEPALEREIAELFAETSAAYLAALVPEADDRSWREAAHSLKGSARSIGARRLALAAAAAEELIGADAAAPRRAAARDEVQAGIVQVVAAFMRLTGGGGA